MKKIRNGLLFLVVVTIVIVGAYKIKDVLFSDTTYMIAGTQAEKTVQAYAQQKGISYDEYPKSLVDLLERNPETEAFVLQYPFRETMPIDLSSYDLSQGVPLFMQWDPRWGYIKYGSDVVGITGCGPVCLAMAGYYVTGDDRFSPDKMVEFSHKNGYYAWGKGTSWSLISEGGVKLGLDVTEIPLVEDRIIRNLEAKNPIICAMGAGDFTTDGHYIVMTAYEDGKIRVNDPNSHKNSERLWSYEEIQGQIRNLWVIRAAG